MRQIEARDIDSLIPYANNSRTHSDAQVSQVAASIKEFGFTNPVLIDEQGGIIAGHGRVMAAKKLGLAEVPCVVLDGLSEAQKKAYIIADNKLALNSGWDADMLKVEMERLGELGFDLSLTGFDDIELGELLADAEDLAGGLDSEKYTDKIEAPIYEIKGEQPNLGECFDTSAADSLVCEVEASNLPKDLKQFLTFAAFRHTRFNYEKIAELYAGQTPEIKNLFERSALVIIDYDKAVEHGYVKLTKDLMALSGGEK